MNFEPASPSELHGHHEQAKKYDHDLPRNIKRLPENLDRNFVEYLTKQGALMLPPDEFRDEVLCRYTEFVHPVLPLLDFNETIAAIDDSTGQSGTISLLLLFSMLYAALPFVEAEHVRRAGYATKLEARAAIYKKAEVSLRYIITSVQTDKASCYTTVTPSRINMCWCKRRYIWAQHIQIIHSTPQMTSGKL